MRSRILLCIGGALFARELSWTGHTQNCEVGTCSYRLYMLPSLILQEPLNIRWQQIPVLSPSYTIPIFPLLNRITCLLSFFLLHTAYYSEEYIAWGYLLLFTHLLCLCRVVGIVLCMYANFIATIANMGKL